MVIAAATVVLALAAVATLFSKSHSEKRQIERDRRREEAAPLAKECVAELTDFARQFLNVATTIGGMHPHRQVSEAGQMLNDLEKEFRRYADAHDLLGELYTARFNAARNHANLSSRLTLGRHQQLARHHAGTVTEFANEIQGRYLD